MKIGKSDIVWSYMSQIFQYAASLLILPIILVKLSQLEIAIWYVFVSIGLLINLVDFGFQPTISRFVSYIYSGAQDLKKEGFDNSEKTSTINYSLLKSVVISVRKIYRYMGILMLVLFSTVGSIYINSISDGTNVELMIAWFLYLLSACINLYYLYYTPLLLGRGLIKQSHKTIVISKLVYILIAYIGVIFGFGLIAVSLANLIGSLLNRIMSHKMFYDQHTIRELSSKIPTRKTKEILNIIWHSSYKMGLVSLGTFLTYRSNIFFASTYLSVTLVASYGLTIQVITVLVKVATLYFNTMLPKFNYLRFNGLHKEYKNLFANSWGVMVTLYLAGTAFIILIGNNLLELIGTETLFLDNNFTVIILLTFLLEINHGISMAFLSTKNTVEYYKSAFLTGVGTVVLSYIFLEYFGLGIYGILFSQFIASFVYNNWRWPLEVQRELGLGYLDYTKIFIKHFNYIIKNGIRKVISNVK
ncbi:hypothetical protein KIS4809_2338 [Bacillus sp. ZZV12-4809]|nr:hypothetical protein KIS4809_2338 [Bacillus sp. ZZV12-4809]